jgi:hypothetical protein
MVARIKLNKGHFQPGHTKSIGNRGYPLARRQTNQFFAKTLFQELTALDPKEQQHQFTLIVRRAIREAKSDGPLAVRFIVDVCNRFLGSPVQPLAVRDYSDEPRKTNWIKPGMSPAEASRIFKEMLRDDGEGLDIEYGTSEEDREAEEELQRNWEARQIDVTPRSKDIYGQESKPSSPTTNDDDVPDRKHVRQRDVADELYDQAPRRPLKRKMLIDEEVCGATIKMRRQRQSG